MPFAIRDGVRIYYRIDGRADAPPLIMVGSLGSDHGMWNPVMPGLSNVFRVIRVDKRGHGASDVPTGDYSIEVLGRDVLAVADTLGLQQFLYAGLSIGGMIGIWLAANAPDRVSRLLISNSSADMPRNTFDERITQVLLHGMASVADTLLGRFFTPAYAARRTEHFETVRQTLLAIEPVGYAGCCAAIRDMDLVPLLPRISAPTLVIAGSADPSTPPDMGRRIANAIPRATFTELPSAHFSPSECPARFTTLAVRFLQGHDVVDPEGRPLDMRLHEDERLRLGIQRRKSILGDQYVEAQLQSPDPLVTRFQALSNRYVWGEVWDNPALSDHNKRLVMMALCIGMGRWEEFRLHAGKGLDASLEPAELEAVLLLAAVYCGMPAANTGFFHLLGLLRDRALAAATG